MLKNAIALLLVLFLADYGYSQVVQPKPVPLESHCAVVIAGSANRVGSCVGAAGCISRTGYLGPVWNPTVYLSCNNFVEHSYKDCIMLHAVGGDCWKDWGWATTCLTFDCYSSVGPLGTAACTPGAMVGSDSVSKDQCTGS